MFTTRYTTDFYIINICISVFLRMPQFQGLIIDPLISRSFKLNNAHVLSSQKIILDTALVLMRKFIYSENKDKKAIQNDLTSW